MSDGWLHRCGMLCYNLQLWKTKRRQRSGVFVLRIRTNLNDPDGSYRVVCRDRASGLMSELMVLQER